MHGRHETVKYCFDKMPNTFKVVMYSTEADGVFLSQFKNVKAYQVPNEPLSNKWNAGVNMLAKFDFEKVVFLGSDDWIDKPFIDYIESVKDYDMIGFLDLYFEHNNNLHWWLGYMGHRKGEPSGAGKTYTKDFLASIDYNLFPASKNRSLDGLSWIKIKKVNAKVLTTTLRENNIICCDVKDGLGMTKFTNIPNIKKANHL